MNTKIKSMTDLASLDTLREAKRTIEVVMPCELVCALKKDTPTLNPILVGEVQVVLTCLTIAVRVICPSP